MANRKRKEKPLPEHLEYLPPAKSLFEALSRRAAPDGMDEPISNNGAVNHLLRQALGVDKDITLRDLVKLTGATAGPPPADIDTRREQHKSLLDARRAGFKENSNPLYAWDVYSICRKEKRHVPPWVLAYFDEVARRMLRAENEPADLPEIMGFRWSSRTRNGGRQAWEQYHSLVIKEEAVGHVLNRLREHPEESIPDACDYAAEKIKKKWGVTREWDTIEQWYKEHK